MVKLTFPRSHSREDIRPLFEKFKVQYPQEFEKWRTREEGYITGAIPSPAEFKIDPIFAATHYLADDFVRKETGCTNRAATGLVFLDFRVLINEEIKQDLQTDSE